MSSTRRSSRSAAVKIDASAKIVKKTTVTKANFDQVELDELDELEVANNENIDSLNKMKISDAATRTSQRKRTPKKFDDFVEVDKKKKETLSRRRHVSQSSSESDVVEVSPPKQGKFVKKQSTKFTPTKLLERLSIDDEQKEEIKLEEPQANKYRNARKILNSGETDSLPGREQELRELTEFLAHSLKDQKSGSMYISGPPGTGKTACLSKLLNRSEHLTSKFKKVYVNCTAISTIGSIYKKICTELGAKVGTEKENLQTIEKYLCGNHKMVLMVLDEIDQLVGKKQSVLYTIFEWPSKSRSKILLIGIANSLDLTDRLLSRLNTKCELKPRLMHFAPYSKQQIIDIFKGRLEEAGVLDIFPPVSIQLLAAKVAAVSGDVRRALDIGRRVVEMAEEQKRGARKICIEELGIEELEQPAAEKVEVKQVMDVLNTVYGVSQKLDEDLEDAFPLQQKILICTLLLMLKRQKNKDITVGRLHTIYAKICTTRNIPAVDQAEFSGLCSLVESRGILRVIRKNEPRLNKIQLQWDEDEVTAALKDRQLISEILADTSCLAK